MNSQMRPGAVVDRGYIEVLHESEGASTGNWWGLTGVALVAVDPVLLAPPAQPNATGHY